jgi:penicillin-binding protein A
VTATSRSTAPGQRPGGSRPAAKRRSRASRLAPLAIVAVGAFGVGVVVGVRHEPAQAAVARKWASAWERGDYRAMHALLSERAQKRASLKRFERTYRQAAETVTLSKVRTGKPRRGDDDTYVLPVRLQTRIFGRVVGNVPLPMTEDEDGVGVDWRAQLVFPGLRKGERLQRTTTLAARGAILARNGTALAKGPDRLSDLGPLAAEVAGRVGPAPPERAEELARRGVPKGAPVGLNGLEREFDERLSGTPGGILRAGTRVVVCA